MMSSEKKQVVTHSGNFHADDVFACATLSLFFGDQISIARSRDNAIIGSADIAVDVGEVYEPSRFRFDHHQTAGAGVRANGIPFASFGLVWKEFGEKVSGSQEVADRIDVKLVAPIDAGDNGYELVTLHTEVSPYKISSLIGSFNASWSENADAINDENFFKMVEFAKEVLKREILIAQDFVKAEALVEEAYQNATDKRIVVLDGPYPGEEVLQKYPEPLYVVRLRQDKRWGVKCIKKESHTFSNRKNLPVAWAGLRDKELQELTGVSDAVFCHKALFLVVAESKEGALSLAKIAVES